MKPIIITAVISILVTYIVLKYIIIKGLENEEVRNALSTKINTYQKTA
jgi:hypothetical protein